MIYALIGRLTVWIAGRVLRKKVAENQAKIGAAAVVVAVLVAGVAAARGGDDE